MDAGFVYQVCPEIICGDSIVLRLKNHRNRHRSESTLALNYCYIKNRAKEP